MRTQQRICGHCLKTCDSDNYKAIEGDMKHVFDVVLPKIDLAAVQELVMCTHCIEMLLKCFDFKAVCFYTYDYIVPLVDDKDKVKLDLKKIYLSKNENGTGISENVNICGFCMNPVKNCLAISFDVKEKDAKLEEMIRQCLPELDLSVIEKPVICSTCHGSLGNCFHFVRNSLIVEEKIKKYCETLDSNRKSRIELSSVLHFTMRDVTSESNGSSVNIIEKEKQLEEINKHDLICGGNKSEHNERNLVGMENQKWLVKEEIEIKTDEQDCSRFEDSIVFPQSKIIRKLYETEESVLKSKRNPSKVKICKCNCCSFQTKHNGNLKLHLLKHRDSSEVIMFKCDSCSFQTKYKRSLKNHSLTHRDSSEVKMFQCDSCSFQTKYKYNLIYHLLSHKDPSEVRIFKCDSCTYQAKQKRLLKSHLLTHMDSSEVKMHQCDFCRYQTKYRHDLAHHLLTHKDPSEVKIYKCASCSFQTKRKKSLRNHLLTHKDPSEVTMFKCDSCSFQAKFRHNLELHLVTHKDPSEVTVYKCASCSFQTKYKRNLRKHLLKHMDSSEGKMARNENCLKRHELTHKNSQK